MVILGFKIITSHKLKFLCLSDVLFEATFLTVDPYMRQVNIMLLKQRHHDFFLSSKFRESFNKQSSYLILLICRLHPTPAGNPMPGEQVAKYVFMYPLHILIGMKTFRPKKFVKDYIVNTDTLLKLSTFFIIDSSDLSKFSRVLQNSLKIEKLYTTPLNSF